MKELKLEKKLKTIIDEIINEFIRANCNFVDFNSAHEGYAVLLEEVDELWENIKLHQATPGRTELIKEEAIQVAAMVIRLIYECCEV